MFNYMYFSIQAEVQHHIAPSIVFVRAVFVRPSQLLRPVSPARSVRPFCGTFACPVRRARAILCFSDDAYPILYRSSLQHDTAGHRQWFILAYRKNSKAFFYAKIMLWLEGSVRQRAPVLGGDIFPLHFCQFDFESIVGSIMASAEKGIEKDFQEDSAKSTRL